MEKWNFIIKNTPKNISEEIESKLESLNGLVYNVKHDKNESITFQLRKRIRYAWYLIFLNSIVVNGKLSKTAVINETDVEISFNQHFLWKLVIFTYIMMGLGIFVAIIGDQNNQNHTSMYLFGALLIGLGIILWISVRKKFRVNVQEYKTLISGMLEF